jgi:hypothetical protein
MRRPASMWAIGVGSSYATNRPLLHGGRTRHRAAVALISMRIRGIAVAEVALGAPLERADRHRWDSRSGKRRRRRWVGSRSPPRRPVPALILTFSTYVLVSDRVARTDSLTAATWTARRGGS